jgi:predicted dehydrogenase
MADQNNRRAFITSAAAAGAFTIVPRHVLGKGFVAPSDKLTLAHIGMGTQGFNEFGVLLNDPAVQIVAICDPNKDSGDYIEWGKGSVRNRIRSYIGDSTWREGDNGCPGGREVGRFVVDTVYKKQREANSYKACNSYADFRELFEKEKDIDAVKIMTPDHLHAAISLAAMNRGKKVAIHKPLSNRMYEERLVIETARKTGVNTHLLAYGSGRANARIAARIKEGAIGRLREIHNWSNRPVWPQYTEIPKDQPVVPSGFDWDLWLGPSLDRPYHPHYTHTVFRGWYEFGGGSMADMGIYSLWPVFETLGLPSPISADAKGTHVCAINDQVSRPSKNDFSYPAACSIRFKFPPLDGMPDLQLFWYDGGIQPRMPEQFDAENLPMPIEGILFLGDKGFIQAGFNGQQARLFANGKSVPLFPDEPEKPEPRWNQEQRAPWVESFLSGKESPGSFTKAAAISDAVCLGTVSLRAGKKIAFDPAAMKITNDEAANRLLYREYRKGWEL